MFDIVNICFKILFYPRKRRGQSWVNPFSPFKSVVYFIYNRLNLWLFQEKDAEQNIISRVPELKQLSSDIDKATTAVINAKLSLESSIRQTQREEGVLGAAVNTISNKVDSINEHIDQVMEDAPTKLKVTVNVSDDDWEKMQKLHNQWMEQEKQMLADQYKQQEALWQKQSHRLIEIVRNNEGVWLSAKLFSTLSAPFPSCQS